MPNWCDNRVDFSGPAEDLVKLKKLIGTDELFISFQRIKPMPESLNMAPGSCTLMYEVVYGDIGKVLNYPWVKEAGITTRNELIRYVKKEQPDYLKWAVQYKSNLERYGFLDWYGWRVANWGTKWNVMLDDIHVIEDAPESLSIEFRTVCSAPRGIYKALLKLFDEHKLNVHATWFYNEPSAQSVGYLS
ncbi:MAG: hypothetical protein ABFR65_11540 [Pseudomonadota bacterium]